MALELTWGVGGHHVAYAPEKEAPLTTLSMGLSPTLPPQSLLRVVIDAR